MKRFALTLPALVTALAVLGLAACGGGDAPSKAEFAEDAENICKGAERRLQNVGEDATSPQEIADAVDKVIAETRKSVDEVRELERPEGDAGRQAGEFVDALQGQVVDQGIPALEALRDAVKDRDQQAAQKAAKRLQEVQSTDLEKVARELGTTACAE